MTLYLSTRNWLIENSNSLGYRYGIALLFSFRSLPLTASNLHFETLNDVKTDLILNTPV